MDIQFLSTIPNGNESTQENEESVFEFRNNKQVPWPTRLEVDIAGDSFNKAMIQLIEKIAQ